MDKNGKVWSVDRWSPRAVRARGGKRAHAPPPFPRIAPQTGQELETIDHDRIGRIHSIELAESIEFDRISRDSTCLLSENGHYRARSKNIYREHAMRSRRLLIASILRIEDYVLDHAPTMRSELIKTIASRESHAPRISHDPHVLLCVRLSHVLIESMA